MKRLYAFVIAAALCFPLSAMAFWHSVQQKGVSAGGGGADAFVSPPIIGTATYSNVNKTVAMTATGVSIQSNNALTGKKVFSVSVDVLTGSDVFVGVTSIGGNTNIAGFDGNRSFGYYNSAGNIWLNSLNPTNGAIYAQSDVIGVAVDIPNSLAWVTSDGTNYFGSTGPLTATQVASGTSGLNIAAVTATGTLFPVVGEDVSGNTMTLQTTYPYTIPSGYSQY